MMAIYSDHIVQIGPHTVAVRFVPGIRDEDGDALHGDYDDTTKTIRINSNDFLDIQRSTLLHELLHAIDDIWSLGLKETGVRVIENALIQSGWK